ncbi:MAG: ATP-binding protein [Planctomycetota bacterium]
MDRARFLTRVVDAFQANPVVALLGPRQCGKTTLARMAIDRLEMDRPSERNYFDLENPTHLARLSTPLLALENLVGLVVVDEIQRRPDLFPVLRVLVDRPDCKARFLILGSASRDLIRQSAESLAGRISHIELTPFALDEVGIAQSETLWMRGGYPRSFLAPSDAISQEWREEYIRTYLERDLPALGIAIPPASIRRFWLMLTHYHGQIFNASEIGRSLHTADTTAKRYLDILTGTFMIRMLRPWYENIGKRQVKAPKIYFRDSGIYHRLLGLANSDQLFLHPKLGASWEGFALEEITRWLNARDDETYFWAVHNQAELDLLVIKDGKRLGYEIKYTDSPRVTRSMQIARDSLRLDALTIVHPGSGSAELGANVRAVGISSLLKG